MIEVEQKFKISGDGYKKLLDAAEFVKEVKNSDILYDDQNFSLLSKDIWLRQRNGEMELKIPKKDDKLKIDIYEEIVGVDEICQALNVQNLDSFLPLYNLVTIRQKYKLANFNIDVDEVFSRINDFRCRLLEIELMVDSESDKEFAAQKIADLAKKYGLHERANGKNIEYMSIYLPEILAKLKYVR